MTGFSANRSSTERHEPLRQPEADGGLALRFRENIRITPKQIGGQTRYLAYDPLQNKHYQLGSQEHRIVRLLSRTADVQQIARELDHPDWSAADVAKFLATLLQAGLVEPINPAAAAEFQTTRRPSRAESSEKVRSSRWEQLAQGTARWTSFAISQRIPLIAGGRVARGADPFIGWLFSLPGFLIWGMGIAFGLTVLLNHWQAIQGELHQIVTRGTWPFLIAIWLLVKLLHEAGHAVAARRYGVAVGTMGVLLFLLTPLAYVDVTGAWSLRSRWQRVSIALAGVYLELFVAALAIVCWSISAPGIVKHLLAQVFLIAGPGTLLVNLNPLLRLDGYYVASDLCEIPNLRSQGRQELAGWIEYLVLGIPRVPSLLSGWRRGFAIIHAGCSVIFQTFWMTGIVAAIVVWAGPVGFALAAAAILGWVVLPLLLWLSRVWQRCATVTGRLRLITTAGTCGVLSVAFFVLPSPFDRRFPVVVRYRGDQVARAPSDAFVKQVLVKVGQPVRKGTPLLHLDNPELVLRWQQIVDEANLAAQRSQMFAARGEEAEAIAAKNAAASLERQADELRRQVDGLSVAAERDGIVVSNELVNMAGRHVRTGDVLLRIVDPTSKELLVSLPTEDGELLSEAAASEGAGSVRLRGGMHLSAELQPPRPRASRQLPHPAMAAPSGGPLAVERTPGEDASEPEYRMPRPRLTSIAVIDRRIAAKVWDGQQGVLHLSDDRSLGRRMLDRIDRFLQARHSDSAASPR